MPSLTIYCSIKTKIFSFSFLSTYLFCLFKLDLAKNTKWGLLTFKTFNKQNSQKVHVDNEKASSCYHPLRYCKNTAFVFWTRSIILLYKVVISKFLNQSKVNNICIIELLLSLVINFSISYNAIQYKIHMNYFVILF